MRTSIFMEYSSSPSAAPYRPVLILYIFWFLSNRQPFLHQITFLDTCQKTVSTRVTTNWRHMDKYRGGMCHRLDGDTWRSTVGPHGHVWWCHMSKPGGDMWHHCLVSRGKVSRRHVSQSGGANTQVKSGQAGKRHVAEPGDSWQVDTCCSTSPPRVCPLPKRAAVTAPNGADGIDGDTWIRISGDIFGARRQSKNG